MGWSSGTEIFDAIIEWDTEDKSNYYELLSPIMVSRGMVDPDESDDL